MIAIEVQYLIRLSHETCETVLKMCIVCLLCHTNHIIIIIRLYLTLLMNASAPKIFFVTAPLESRLKQPLYLYSLR